MGKPRRVFTKGPMRSPSAVIGRGREHWTAWGQTGFGEVRCDTIVQATQWATSRPWASDCNSIKLHLGPFSFGLFRSGNQWALTCGQPPLGWKEEAAHG